MTYMLRVLHFDIRLCFIVLLRVKLRSRLASHATERDYDEHDSPEASSLQGDSSKWSSPEEAHSACSSTAG